MKTRLYLIAGISVTVFLLGVIIYPYINETQFEDYASHDIKTELDNTNLPSDNYVVEIPFEQTIQYEDLELYFYDVEDSRCPVDVSCIWEGQVTAMIHVKNQTHKISGYFTPNHTVNYITPYNVTLVDIQPHPVSTEKPEYVATVEIKKLE